MSSQYCVFLSVRFNNYQNEQRNLTRLGENTISLGSASLCIFKFPWKFHIKTQFVPHRKLSVSITITNWSSQHREVTVVYCEIT